MAEQPATNSSKSWLVFALVFVWKLALLVVAALPVPANDSFFYDGAVVNWLLHGKYVNPSLALVFPISGTEVFSAYPPLYQALLLPWMVVFGTSAMAAMTLHLLLFGGYLLVLLAILRRLCVPAWCANIAGAFLPGLTFHDRPDSLAHVLGMLAVYAWVRSWAAAEEPLRKGAGCWAWAMAGFSVLCMATSVQIGATYGAMLWAGILVAKVASREKPPLPPMLAMVVVPAALIALVVVHWPQLWAGFQEHARHTPSLTGLRVPQLADLLKVGRTVPGVLAVMVLLPLLFAARPMASRSQRLWVVTLAGTVTGLAVVVACLLVLTANVVAIVSYLQPLIVGCFLAGCALSPAARAWSRRAAALFLALALLGSIRAIGMTTWGLACAADLSHATAIRQVRQEMADVRPGQTVILSAAYLYEAARRQDIRGVHCDWLGEAALADPNAYLDAMLSLKPRKLVLTQFDYYRRYEPLVARLKARPEVAEVSIRQTAGVPAPDSIASLQRVVQHISWAPVIVAVQWRP